MLGKVYKWERKHYKRHRRGARWVDDPDGNEVLYITPSWRDVKIGDQERAFWRAIGARFIVSHDPYRDITKVHNISPGGLAKCAEVFTPISIPWVDTWREKQALLEASDQRVIPVLEDTGEHVVLRFGEETTADYDLMTGLWVG